MSGPAARSPALHLGMDNGSLVSYRLWKDIVKRESDLQAEKQVTGPMMPTTDLMELEKRPVGRPPAKQREIVDALRGQIVAGRLTPGARVPTRAKIERRFKASPLTVQRAMNALIRDGFVRAEPRGTFVCDRPPHLRRYGMVFHSNPQDEGNWRQFYSALLREAADLQQRAGIEIPAYYDINDRVNPREHRHLLADLRAHRLAGVVLLTNSNAVLRTLARLPDMPAVSLLIGDHPKAPRFPGVAPDYGVFFDRAVAYLAQQQRRRIALIVSAVQYRAIGGHFEAAMLRHGLDIARQRIQMPGLSEPEGAENAAHLLFHAEQNARPDGLIVADDNFVRHAVRGLMSAGIRVPGDLVVVAHANFPSPDAPALPIRRLGFHARDVLETCVRLIGDQRRQPGVPLPEITRIPAVFEDEAERAAPTAAKVAP